MRIAAVLLTLSSVLCEQIFQLNYILKSRKELSDLLDNSLDQDATKERHLRAELLTPFPEKQEGNGTARADSAVVDIFASYGALIPKDKQWSCWTSLEKVCKLALAQ
jgi:hypothetical protein